MRIHFVGIGGIGMSALAQYYLAKGHKVTGSDLTRSEMTDLLQKKGAKVFLVNSKFKMQNAKSQLKIQNADLIIYSPAIPRDHSELSMAKRLGKACKSYPKALGELTKQYFTIAVSGTHGKSTTSAMIATILIKAGLNPTVILGTKLREFNNSNFRMGGLPKPKFKLKKSTLYDFLYRGNRTEGLDNRYKQFLVIEADEHFASFLNYWPKMIVLTNIEADHLDYYKNLNNIKKAFREFIEHLPNDGTLVVNADDINSKFKSQKSKAQVKIQKYSLCQKEAKHLRKILKIPGKHNVANALAALSAARALGIADKVSLKALSEYRGSWRRFEIKEFKIQNQPYGEQAVKFKIISDYAHHPTEIKATIRAAKEKFPGQKIWAVFQPHQIARTVALFDDFVTAFDEADAVVLTNIFEVAGRDERRPPKNKNMKVMAAKLKKCGKETYLIPNFRKIPKFLQNKIGKDDVILIMGAGDIYIISSPAYWK